MRFFKRFIVLLLVYALAALSTFGIVTWYYQINVLEKLEYQLYGGIGAGVLSLLTGLLLVIVKKRKKPAKQADKTEKKIETAAVKAPAVEEHGIKVDEIPQQPDLPEMPVSVEPLIEETPVEEIHAEEETVPETASEEISEPETAEPEIEETVEEKPEETLEEAVPAEESVVEETLVAEAEEPVEEPDINIMETTTAMPVISPLQEEVDGIVTEDVEVDMAPAASEAVDMDNVSAVDVQKGPEEVKQAFVDDTTRVISTAAINDYLAKIRKTGNTEVSKDNADKSEILLPLGPKPQVTRTPEPVEEPAVEETPEENITVEPVEAVTENVAPVEEAAALPDVPEITEEQPELILRPLPEKEENEIKLSQTQEHFITKSTNSYIDETGKPQFKVTQEIKTVKIDEEEKGKNFVGFDVKAEREEKVAHFLNTVIAILVIRIVLILIYYLYNRFFG